MYWRSKGQLARAYEIGEDYRTAIAIARECLGKDGDERNETLYDLAICYARINILDSAEYFLNLADTSVVMPPSEEVSRYLALEQIAWLRGDTAEYRKYNQLSKSFARNHVRTTHDSEIFTEESKFKIENLNEQNISLSNRNNLLLVLAVILLLILAAIVLVVIRRRRELMEAREMVRALQREKSLKPDEQISMNLKDPRLIEHISRQISMIQEFADLSFEGSIYPKNFLEKFRKLMKISRPSESFWPDLKAYVNETHDGLIDRITSQCELTEPEVNLICMETLGFSNVQEMVCLGYTNTNSITNKKKKVAQKLGAKLSLKKYIEFELKKTES